MHDLRIGLRMLRKTPGSTLAIAGLLALGIGASTVIFSLFDALLLRPLPARHAERLVRVVQHLPRIGAYSSFDYAYYEALRDHATTLESVFGQYGEFARFAMTEPLPAEPVTATLVTPEFFDGLGIQALHGRALTAADARDGGTVPAVLSYGFWQRRFHGDRQVLGRTLVIQGHAFVVVGIMPRGVNGLTVDTAADVRVPARALPLLTTLTLDEADGFEIAGRLKPGVTRAQAYAECLSLWQSVMRSSHKGSASLEMELSRGITLDPLERGTSMLRERFGGSLELIMASVGLLLLMVCVNIAGLLLARMTARQQEIVVRLAVGATRARLMRQMLAESLPLAVAGAARRPAAGIHRDSARDARAAADPGSRGVAAGAIARRRDRLARAGILAGGEPAGFGDIRISSGAGCVAHQPRQRAARGAVDRQGARAADSGGRADCAVHVPAGGREPVGADLQGSAEYQSRI